MDIHSFKEIGIEENAAVEPARESLSSTNTIRLARTIIDILSETPVASLTEADAFLGTEHRKLSGEESRDTPEEYFLGEVAGGIIIGGLATNLNITHFQTYIGPHSDIIDTSSSDSTVFKLKSGIHIKVSTNEDGKVDSIDLLYNNFNIASPEKAFAAFVDVLKSEGVVDEFLLKNPYHQEEVEVAGRLKSKVGVDIDEIESARLTGLGDKQVLMIPDQHGDSARIGLLRELMCSGECDWVALEMLPHTLQPVIEEFLDSEDGSAEFNKARDELEGYFEQHWNTQFGEQESVADNPYYQLLNLAKSQNLRVFGIDTDGLYYKLNPQTAPLIVGTRNLTWAMSTPTEGRGLVFGGLAHFGWNNGVNVQDFLADRIQKEKLGMVKFDA